MRALLPLLLVFTACSADDGPEGALEAALSRARPMPGPSDSPTTTWASPVPLRGLRNHALDVDLSLRLVSPRGAQALVITRHIERRDRMFRVSETRSHEEPSAADSAKTLAQSERFEAVFDGVRIAVRRGEGPFIERDARDGLPTRTLVRLHDLAPFLLTALKDDIRLEPLAPDETTPSTVEGVPVTWRRVVFLVEPERREPLDLMALRQRESTLPQWLGESVVVTRGGGRVAFVDAPDLVDGGGRPKPEAALLVDLALEGEAKLGAGDTRQPFSLSLKQRVSLLVETTFELPPERLPERRERTWKMIDEVLGDELLPPYRAR